MEGNRRDEEDMQDSLLVEEGMIVKFPLVPYAICLPPLQLLLQEYFQQEKDKQPDWRDTQRPNIMNYMVPEQCNHSGKTLSRNSSLSKHMIMVHGASHP